MSNVPDVPDDESIPQIFQANDGRSPRVDGLAGLPDTPRRRELRRVGTAVRDIIEFLVSTTASTEVLTEAAVDLEAIVATLSALPTGRTYRGFAEAANAGSAIRDANDPEWFAFFDHSPFIGLANPLSPPVELSYEEHNKKLLGRVTFGAAYEGPPGCVHGGYVAGVFDELLGAAQSMSGSQGVTAHLGIDYRRPTPLGVPLVLEGWLERHEGRKIYAKGAMYFDGELTAEADALFIAFDREKFRALLADRNEGLGPNE